MNKSNAVELFKEALAWGFVYGPALSNKDWDKLRDEMAQQFTERLFKKENERC